MRWRHLGTTVLLAGSIALVGCGSRDGDVDANDPGKIDAEMEARARDIEARASAAAVAVEREAQAELDRIEREAGAPSADASGAATAAGQQ